MFCTISRRTAENISGGFFNFWWKLFVEISAGIPGRNWQEIPGGTFDGICSGF